MKLSSDDLPMFFTDAHARLADRLRAAAPAFAAVEAPGAYPDEPARDRAAVAALAEAGLFELVVPRTGSSDGAGPPIDLRGVCLAREMLGYVSPRADSIFVCQGLGTYAIGVAGSPALRAELPAFSRGARIAALALTEPEAGSDVAAIATRATEAPGGYQLDGDKLFISNLGIADHAMVVATVDPTGDAPRPAGGAVGVPTPRDTASPIAPARGHAGLTAFWLALDTPGVTVRPLTAIAAHPIGALELRGAVVPAAARIGEAGQGMRLGLDTLDAFRASVGAAAVGMARRALDEALGFVTVRRQFGKPLSEQPLVQAHLADMVVDLDAARLLVLRAAHRKDTTGGKLTTEVSIAKLGATEAAQRVIDRAVQLFGGRGVMAGAVVEQLYRAIRPLRIYEGTSEIQRTIIGRALAKQGRTG